MLQLWGLMKGNNYYALTVTPSSHYELFQDFLLDSIPIGFEELDGSFIIRSEDSLETIVWGIEQFAQALSASLHEPVSAECTIEEFENEDWLARYKEGIKSIQVGPFYIHPTWEAAHSDAINIAIDPALAFGTGHHPTTASVLEAMSTYVQEGMELLDVGCGSGILTIAAAKLGAVVTACDTDEQCIDNSAKNLALNAVTAKALCTGSVSQLEGKFDIVVANIVSDVLVFLRNDLQNVLKNGAILILSGILEQYEDKVTEAFSALTLENIVRNEEWVTLIYRK